MEAPIFLVLPYTREIEVIVQCTDWKTVRLHVEVMSSVRTGR